METTTEVEEEVGPATGINHTCSSEENYVQGEVRGQGAVVTQRCVPSVAADGATASEGHSADTM